MTNAYVVTGTVADRQTLRLDEPLPVAEGEVRVTVEVLRPTPPVNDTLAVMEQVWEGQRRRGHVPPTGADVESQVRAERDGWGD